MNNFTQQYPSHPGHVHPFSPQNVSILQQRPNHYRQLDTITRNPAGYRPYSYSSSLVPHMPRNPQFNQHPNFQQPQFVNQPILPPQPQYEYFPKHPEMQMYANPYPTTKKKTGLGIALPQAISLGVAFGLFALGILSVIFSSATPRV